MQFLKMKRKRAKKGHAREDLKPNCLDGALFTKNLTLYFVLTDVGTY